MERRVNLSELNVGQEIQTKNFVTLKVIEELGRGGQGIVYRVDYGGKEMALKWFIKGAMGEQPDKFYKNLEHNISKGSPTADAKTDIFLWPKDITDWIDGTFGYVMEIRPKDYVEFTKILTSKKGGGFKTYKAIVEVCIRIVSAFRLLHNKGYSYQDINAGNFFINPKSGKVLICDNDNVAPNQTNMGVIGTPQYMAPEIVKDMKVRPSTNTDEFSLAVVLFILLGGDHPLQGKHWTVPCLTPSIEKKLYGTHPIFVFDPEDDSNRPVKGVHDHVINRWRVLPKYLKEKFEISFSQDAIKNPNKRLKELEWLKVLTRFQSDIVRCQNCKGEVFVIDSKATKCDVCGKLYEIKNALQLKDYSVPVAKNTRIYRCQLGVCNAEDALTPIVSVITKNDVFGLRNVSGVPLKGITPGGKINQIKPDAEIPAKSGIVIEYSNGKINII